MKSHITTIVYTCSFLLFFLLIAEIVGGIIAMDGYELVLDPEGLAQSMSYFLAVILTFAGAAILLCLARILELLEERANGWWR